MPSLENFRALQAFLWCSRFISSLFSPVVEYVCLKMNCWYINVLVKMSSWEVIYLKKKHHSCVFFTPNFNDDQNTCNNTWIKSIYNEYYHKPWDILFFFHVYFNSFFNVYINVISTALLKIQCDVHFPSVIWKLKMYPVSDHTFSLHFKLQSILSCLFMEPSFSLITKQKTKHIQSNETSCNKLPTYYSLFIKLLLTSSHFLQCVLQQ